MVDMDSEKIEKYRNQCEQRVNSESSSLEDSNQGDELPSNFILDCLNANELGDGSLFIALNSGKFIYDTAAGEWMTWDGSRWKRDEMGLTLSAVDAVAEKYIEEAVRITWRIGQESTKNKGQGNVESLQKTQKELYRRVKKLRSETGRIHCLNFAHANPNNPLVAAGEVFDQKPWLLPCQNGVINLKTGELETGRPEDYMRKASNVEWKGIEAPAPIWDNFLNDIFSDNDKLVDYVRRLLGYGMTGTIRENVLPVLCGDGRNGKSVLVKTIQHVMGELASTVSSDILLDQGRFRNSSAPSPDIMAFRGVRLAFASETEQGRRFATARVKFLSGGDRLRGRYPHDKYEVEFAPTHLLLLMTNFKPGASADDFAFWERVQLIPFDVKFVSGRDSLADDERPADTGLAEKLKVEAPGILAWLARGCLEWQRVGLRPPTIVLQATAEYRRGEDILGDFIEECCVVHPDAKVQAKHIYDRFDSWWTENISNRVPSQRRFGGWLQRRFERVKQNTYVYFGVGLLQDQDQIS